MSNKQTDITEFDLNHVWHPYTSMTNPLPAYQVTQAQGVYLSLQAVRN